jgi:hypothetical protein
MAISKSELLNLPALFEIHSDFDTGSPARLFRFCPETFRLSLPNSFHKGRAVHYLEKH